jgi:DNA-directed RNA polymerase subunit RPC12/RpoP
MSSLNWYNCDKCGFHVKSFLTGRDDAMLKGDNHKSSYYCAKCQKQVEFFLDKGRKCPECGLKKLVGEHVFDCPECREGKMIEEEGPTF